MMTLLASTDWQHENKPTTKQACFLASFSGKLGKIKFSPFLLLGLLLTQNLSRGESSQSTLCSACVQAPSISEVDETTWSTLREQLIAVPDVALRGLDSHATHPHTDELHGVGQCRVQIQQRGALIKANPLTGKGASIAETNSKLAGVAFDCKGTLWAASGYGAECSPFSLSHRWW